MWSVLGAALAGICAIHMLTLTISPTLWADEAEITDQGRIMLFSPHSTWAMSWWIAQRKPVLVWFYIGPDLHELAYRVLSIAGPRLFEIMCAALATIILVGWLRARGTPQWIALVLGLVVFLDPIFVESYRGARADAAAFVFGLLACWLIRASKDSSRRSGVSRLKLAFAGAAAAVTFFVWTEGLLLYPLILFELVTLVLELRRSGMPPRRVMIAVGALIAAGVVSFAILLVPIVPLIPSIVAASQLTLHSNAGLSVPHVSQTLKFWAISPFFPLLAAATLSTRKNWPLGAITLAMLVYQVQSPNFHAGRLTYLLPYFAALVGTAGVAARSRRGIWRVYVVALALLVAWAGGVTLFLRTANALEQQAQRNPNLLPRAASASIGYRPARVSLFQGPWELYYAGRQHGWHMYSNEWFLEPHKRYLQLWSTMDDAIFPLEGLKPQIVHDMRLSGLRYRTILLPRTVQSTSPSVIARLITRFGIGAKGYGPYVLFSRRPIN